MRKNLSKKALATLAATAVVVAGATVAYAYWTTTGSGAGSAAAGAPVPADAIDLDQDSAITGLYPGGPTADIMVTATNPADFNQVVGEVTVSITAYPAGCGAANWDLVNEDDSFGNVAANTTSAAQSVGTIALNETGANQDVCQNVGPTFSFSSASGE